MSSDKHPSPVSVRLVYVLALLTSFSNMSYELVLAQTLSVLTDETVLWESLTIGLFLAATGLGVFLFDRMKKTDLLAFFTNTEGILALLGLLALPLILTLHIIYRISIADYYPHSLLTKPLHWVMLACEMPTVLIGILSGFELRTFFRFLTDQEQELEKRLGAFLLVVCHLGALLASLAFALVLHTRQDSFFLVLLASAINAGIFVLFRKRNLAPTLGFLIVYVWTAPLWSSLKELHLKNFYYNGISAHIENGVFTQAGPVPLSHLLPWAATQPAVQRSFSPYQTIDIVPNPDNTGEWKLFLDGHFQFSSETERSYHETLAHVPIMMTGKVPSRVLLLGAGDGLLARELFKYKEQIARIDLVELDPDMISLGKSLPFRTLNASSLLHPRMHVKIADAFTWLRQNTDRFDAIYIDFPYPYTFEGLRLYSQEFMSLLARRLQNTGFVMMDIPIFGAGEARWQAHVQRLLANAGFQEIWAMEARFGEGFLFARKESPPEFRFREMGIALETLTANWFTSEAKVLRLNAPLQAQVPINSVLKPRRLSIPDVWK